MISPYLSIETDKVMLRPLMETDIPFFSPLTNEASLWRYFTFELNEKSELEKWVLQAINDREKGIRFPFTIIEKATNTITGSTSYGNISFFDKRIEIGWSWLGIPFQGTGINFHAKFCLLNYAFEILKFERIEIKTDNLNERAKQALRKIGSIEEGVLRSHMQMPKGRRRDSVYFSIIKNDWPTVRNSIFKDIQTFSYKNEHS